jgi:hypothetical protein
MDQRNNNLVFEELSRSLSNKKIVNAYLVSLAHQTIPAAMWIHLASFATCAAEVMAKKTEAVRIFKLLRSLGIDSAILCSLAGLYNNPIPTRFLAPKDCSTTVYNVMVRGALNF